MLNRLKMFLAPAAMIMGIPAVASADYITNGNFETYNVGQVTKTAPSQLGTDASAGYSVLSGWTVGSGTYGFLMAPGAADTTGSYSPQFGNTFKLWGSNDKGSTTDPVATLPATSPTGGNYVVLDGASGYRGTGISQAISGLTIGQQYLVNFAWASGQQFGYDGPTDEWLQVSLGKQVQSTAVAHNVTHGFTNWAKQGFVFTADATSTTLNFLAMSTTGGLPPMVLLDGVSMNAVPEPASLALVGLGLAAAAATRRIRRGKGATA